MRSIITKLPRQSLINRITTPSTSLTPPFSLSAAVRNYSTETKPRKIDRIADELLSLNAVELHDYSILFGLRMGLKNSALAAGPGPAAQTGGATEGAASAEKEKTVFEVKLEKYEAGAKIKIIKEVRSFTDLGLKEAKDLVEKVPAVVKTGVSKEEGEAIVAKLKLLGASVVLE